MRRIKLVLQYDGTGYSGWQRQPGATTIQGELEKALEQVTQEKIETFGASRTDAGVHALGQTVHFDDAGKFNLKQYLPALNSVLPDQIGVVSAQKVSNDFHARFDPEKKWYRYHIFCGRNKPIFRKNAAYLVVPLDLKAMQEAASYLVGEHDFTSFKTLTEENKDQNAVRTLFDIDIKRGGEEVLIDIWGNGFLYKMVRGLVGTLVEVGRGKEEPKWVKKVLKAKDRQKGGKNMPPEGLFLMQVFYKKC